MKTYLFYTILFALAVSFPRISASQSKKDTNRECSSSKNQIVVIKVLEKPLESGEYLETAIGSGIITGVDYQGKAVYISTAKHVIVPANNGLIRLKIKFNQDRELNWYEGVVLSEQLDLADDLAFIKVNVSQAILKEIKRFPTGKPKKLLDDIFLFGHSNERAWGTSVGKILNPEVGERHFYISPNLNTGDSGGGVFDKYGNLIGMIQRKEDKQARCLKIETIEKQFKSNIGFSSNFGKPIKGHGKWPSVMKTSGIILLGASLGLQVDAQRKYAIYKNVEETFDPVYNNGKERQTFYEEANTEHLISLGTACLGAVSLIYGLIQDRKEKRRIIKHPCIGSLVIKPVFGSNRFSSFGYAQNDISAGLKVKF